MFSLIDLDYLRNRLEHNRFPTYAIDAMGAFMQPHHAPSPLRKFAAKGGGVFALDSVNRVNFGTRALPFWPRGCIGRAKILNPSVRKAPR